MLMYGIARGIEGHNDFSGDLTASICFRPAVSATDYRYLNDRERASPC